MSKEEERHWIIYDIPKPVISTSHGGFPTSRIPICSINKFANVYVSLMQVSTYIQLKASNQSWWLQHGYGVQAQVLALLF